MRGVNKVIIIGRLGADPEVKTLSTGQSVTRFNMATTEEWTKQDGTKQEKTEWHRITVWNKLGEVCAKYLFKGSAAYIEGKIRTSSWEDEQGQKKYSTEIVANQVQFLSSKSDQKQDHTSQPPAPTTEPSFTGDTVPF